MSRYIPAVTLCLAAISAQAETPSIQNHKVQRLFMQGDCTAAVAQIDATPENLKSMGQMAMAFGFLMGFEAAHPGIRGTHETILMRLRVDCAANPSRTAFDLLQSYLKP